MSDSVVGRLVYLLTGDTKELDQSIESSNKRVEKFGKTLKNVGGQFNKKLTLPMVAATAIPHITTHVTAES